MKSFYNTFDRYSFLQYPTGQDIDATYIIDATEYDNTITIRNTGNNEIYVNNLKVIAGKTIVIKGQENEITNTKIIVYANTFLSNQQRFVVIKKKYIQNARL